MNKIATLSIIGILTFGNILIGNAKTYRATQTNSEGKVVTVTLSEGDDQKVIEPLKQFRFKYNSDGLPVEKVVYKWNSDETKWVENAAYKYEYDRKDRLVELQYAKWDDKTLAWNKTELTMFSNVENNKLLTINYLDTIK